MLCDLKDILEIGQQGNFAVPAFNVYNLETVLGVMNAAEEAGAPVIFQMYSRLLDGQNAQYVAPIILEAAKNMKVPVAFHLDHGTGVNVVLRALRYGATGIMIDASKEPLEANIEKTRNVVAMCNEVGVSVEGELGHIGTTKEEIGVEHTKVDEAVRYVKETGVSALAIMVGTAHGHYKQAPVLNIQRIREIHEATPAHLVLHGGSGVPDEQIKAAIDAGITKINFSTDLCCAFMNTVREVDSSIVAIDLAMVDPINAVKQFALSKIKLLGADKK